MKQVKIGILVALVILLHSLAWISWKGMFLQIERENGVMENFQAGCLLLAIGIWGWSMLKSRFRPEQILLGSLALFSASILVLEVDFRQMDAPLLNAVMNGKIRDLWLGSFWLVAAILFIRNRKPVFQSFVAWIKTPKGAFMLLGGVFWILSAAIDKSLLGTKDLFNEELMEVNATLFMTVSAVLSLRGLIKQNGVEPIGIEPIG